MKRDWTRSEPKAIRPFFAVGDLQTCLDAAEIVTGHAAMPSTDEVLVLDPDAMVALDVRLSPRLDVERVVASLGEGARDYALVVTVRTPQTMHRSCVARFALDEVPEEIHLAAADLADGRRAGELHVGLDLCLVGDVTPEPGWPTHAGAFLARKRFHLRLERHETSFAFLPLDEDVRKARRLPEGAMIAVDLQSAGEGGDEDAGIATIYVAPKVLDAMRARPAVSAAMSPLVIDALFEEAVREGLPTRPPEEGRLHANLLDLARKGQGALEWDDFRTCLAVPERRRALAYGATGMIDAMGRIR
ncbi:MAG: hypothetical protein ACU0CO_17680 [Shimia sp.]